MRRVRSHVSESGSVVEMVLAYPLNAAEEWEAALQNCRLQSEHEQVVNMLMRKVQTLRDGLSDSFVNNLQRLKLIRLISLGKDMCDQHLRRVCLLVIEDLQLLHTTMQHALRHHEMIAGSCWKLLSFFQIRGSSSAAFTFLAFLLLLSCGS